MGEPAPGLSAGDPFAPPRVEARLDRSLLWRVVGFLVSRLVRIGLSPLVLALSIGLALGLEPTGVWLTWLLAALLWLPSSAVMFRLTFFPAPPERWLREMGAARSARDLRTTNRVQVAEYALGSLPLLWLSVWMGQLLPVPGWAATLATLAVGAYFLYRMGRAALALVLHEAELALAMGEAHEARRRLAPLAALPWLLGDHGRILLSWACFREGDLEPALATLDQVRDRQRWRVAPLRVQMSLERMSMDDALAEAARLKEEHPAAAEVIELLALLHADRTDEVLARQGLLETLPVGEPRMSAALVLAAALAETDPERATALLQEQGLTVERAISLGSSWRALRSRLTRLAPALSDGAVPESP